MTLPGIGDLYGYDPTRHDSAMRCERCGLRLRRDWTCPVHGDVTTIEDSESEPEEQQDE